MMRVRKFDEESCLEGAYCGHAILTVKIGVYRCPFGECFKEQESQEQVGSQMMEAEAGVLSCVLFPDVPCSFRKSEKFGIMNRCSQCPHCRRFEREMDEEDERVMDEIDDVWKNPEKYGYSRG